MDRESKIIELEEDIKELSAMIDAGNFFRGGDDTLAEMMNKLKILKKGQTKKMRGGMVKRKAGGKVKKQSGHNRLY
tara:strand:+ start:1098 stop:1325 length:228 start_codon:yes stop_codon:yes gene_type:complete